MDIEDDVENTPIAMASTSTSSTAASGSKGVVPAKSWTHFVAGGLGGMCGAIVTSPFDVVKTRLQSSLFHHTTAPRTTGAAMNVNIIRGAATSGGGGAATAVLNGGAVRLQPGGLLYNFVETGHIIRDMYLHESPRALFKGLGPTLVGVVPARSINFFTYGNGKQVIAQTFNHGQENSIVHLFAAATAGIATSTSTNPLWVVKTRLQLIQGDGGGLHGARGSWAVIKQIYREAGIRGFYKGMTASYLGVTEGTIQWVLYERLKKLTRNTTGQNGGWSEWAGMMGSAGTAKCVASLITYPHEVLRTRLRQPPPTDGPPKYTGLWRTLRIVVAEEGARSMYNGLSAHLMRVIPNSAVMYAIYEAALRMNI